MKFERIVLGDEPDRCEAIEESVVGVAINPQCSYVAKWKTEDGALYCDQHKHWDDDDDDYTDQLDALEEEEDHEELTYTDDEMREADLIARGDAEQGR